VVAAVEEERRTVERRRSGGARLLRWRRSGTRLLWWRRIGGAAAALGLAEEEERRRVLKRKKGNETIDGSVEKELRPAFQGLTGHAPRLTGRAVEASGQSLVRSKCDRTCPFRGDRTRTESGQKSTREPTSRDRTRR
jgi:hypothetical protein